MAGKPGSNNGAYLKIASPFLNKDLAYLKDWDQLHTIGVLREALAQGDGAAYLAYHAGVSHTAAEYAEALAVIGCTADSLGLRRRPWEIEPSELSLPEWRQRVWKLLLEMPGNALPKPTEGASYTGGEADRPKALPQELSGLCPAGTDGEGRRDEP